MLNPDSAPPVAMTAAEKAGLWPRVVSALIPPLTLIAAVLGSIIGGIATPTEAASVGSMGALFLCIVKLLADRWRGGGDAVARDRALLRFWLFFIGVLAAVGAVAGAFGLLTLLIVVVAAGAGAILADRRLRPDFLDIVNYSSLSTMTSTSMVFIILLGATAFALVFTRMGGDVLVQQFLGAMPGGKTGAVILVMLIMFVLGFFLDTFEIIFIVVPITAPILLMMGMDPILLGVMIGLVLQTSFLTPPFGFALFYLRGVAPPVITTGMLYRGVVPFVAIQLVVVFFVFAVPQTAIYLPNLFFRDAPGTIVVPAPASDPNVPEVEGEMGG
jgi:TRAP-type mannitol/chloroaromatic compound transport system permease large subunit